MRLITSVFMMLCIIAVPLSPAFAKSKGKTGAASTAEDKKFGAIIVDANSGTILYEKGADKVLHPASLTKVMTLLLLFEAMENGTVRQNDRIMISGHADDQKPSKLGLGAGASIRVEDAILAVVTKSANDIAVAIGEHLAGSEERFAERMTRRAHDIGMTRTNFVNASGLHSPRQVSSPRDMAILARYILFRYPNYYRYFGTRQFTYRGKTYTNHNRLMQSYPGMDGFKTGFISQSGFNLIASAKSGDTRLIGVVFGGTSWKARNDKMASLLNGGFSKMNEVRYAKATGGAPPKGLNLKTAQNIKAPPVPAAKPASQQASRPDERPQQPGPVQTATATTPAPPGRAGAPSQILTLPQGYQTQAATTPNIGKDAMVSVRNAINRGEYSELTGQGDLDPGAARRVETGLLAATVYKGETAAQQQQRTRDAAANDNDPAGALVQQFAARQQIQPAQAPPQAPATRQASAQALTPISVPALAAKAPARPASELWSVQIGAYTSRLATDDALRDAAAKLPQNLAHAMPVVVPMQTGNGTLFRARLGGFTQEEANQACRYFRDCLPMAPR